MLPQDLTQHELRPCSKEVPSPRTKRRSRTQSINSARKEKKSSRCSNGYRDEDHDAESCSRQTEQLSTEEHAEEAPLISGPQSMLNVFKARADAAIEASGDSPSFTDRKLHPPPVAVASRSCRADLRVFQ